MGLCLALDMMLLYLDLMPLCGRDAKGRREERAEKDKLDDRPFLFELLARRSGLVLEHRGSPSSGRASH